MLKIKDNVDLKELEKYNIKKGYSMFNMSNIYGYIDDSNRIFITTKPWWSMDYYYLYEDGENTLYDLIQAGLVEKVNGGK